MDHLLERSARWKKGVRTSILFFAFFLGVDAYAEVRVHVAVDRDQIALDESVSLKFTVESDESVSSITPQFQAPDFDTINQYQGQNMETIFENGKLNTRFSKMFTYVLKPLSVGTHILSNLSIQVQGKEYPQSNLSVRVIQSEVADEAPKRSEGTPLFIQAEVSKDRVYKGEQVVVSYYLYSRARRFNVNADRFPTLEGFLKEELEMPVIQGRLKESEVTLNGKVYKKVLIAKYAAWPLKEGKLKIDSFRVKAKYIPQDRPKNSGLGYDPWADTDDLFQQFFGQFAPQFSPQEALLKSNLVTLEVLPLPGPTPQGFSGAVGSFTVSSMLDQERVQVNGSVHLTLKIEGQGNLSILDPPRLTLPQGVEIFESKARTKITSGQKIYDYLLIPRKSGRYHLPGIPFIFFDPKAKSYRTVTTDPLSLEVSGGQDQGSQEGTPLLSQNASPQAPAETIPILQKEDLLSSPFSPKERFFYLKKGALFLLLFSCSVLFYQLFKEKFKNAFSQWLRRRKGSSSYSQWEKIKKKLVSINQKTSYQEVVRGYSTLSEFLYQLMESQLGTNLRSLSRQEMKELLTERYSLETNWVESVLQFFEFSEMVQFASRVGALQEQEVRQRLKSWMLEVQKITERLKGIEPTQLK